MSRGIWTLPNVTNSESLTIRRRTNDNARTIGITLHGLARVRRACGDYAGARALLYERLAHSRETQDVVQISMALAGLGLVALLEGDYSEAESFYRDSLIRSREVNDQYAVATALIGLALTEVGLGEPGSAWARLGESLAIARTTGGRQLLALSLEGFAAVLAATGQARRSWQLVATVAEYRERLMVPQDPSDRILLDRLLNVASTPTDGHERAAIMMAGRGFTVDQAISEIEMLDTTAPARSDHRESVAIQNGQVSAELDDITDSAGNAVSG